MDNVNVLKLRKVDKMPSIVETMEERELIFVFVAAAVEANKATLEMDCCYWRYTGWRLLSVNCPSYEKAHCRVLVVPPSITFFGLRFLYVV